MMAIMRIPMMRMRKIMRINMHWSLVRMLCPCWWTALSVFGLASLSSGRLQSIIFWSKTSLWSINIIFVIWWLASIMCQTFFAIILWRSQNFRHHCQQPKNIHFVRISLNLLNLTIIIHQWWWWFIIICNNHHQVRRDHFKPWSDLPLRNYGSQCQPSAQGTFLSTGSGFKWIF